MFVVWDKGSAPRPPHHHDELIANMLPLSPNVTTNNNQGDQAETLRDYLPDEA